MIEISNILEVKNHIQNLKAVIFDLDDTLIDNLENVRYVFTKISDFIY